MSNEQKTSAEAIQRYYPIIYGADTRFPGVTMAFHPDADWVRYGEHLAALARVRREARAEAFKFIEDELRAEGRTVSADYVEELAAKERA